MSRILHLPAARRKAIRAAAPREDLLHVEGRRDLERERAAA
ncbi:hypothetical protein [Sorangium sp. So ce1182]